MTREEKLHDLHRRLLKRLVGHKVHEIFDMWVDFYRDLARIEAEAVFGMVMVSAPGRMDLVATAAESAIQMIVDNVGTGLDQVEDDCRDQCWPPKLTDTLPSVVRQAFEQRVAELQASFASTGGRA